MSNEPPRRGRGRPSAPLLSREKIVEAAFVVLAQQGAAGFSLARVAAHLGTQRPALYNHIADKDDLVALMRDSATADIDWSGFGVLPWDEAFESMAWSYREVFSREPELTTLLAVTPIRASARSIQNRERCTSALIDEGWPDYMVTSVIVAVESFIIGSGLDALAGPATDAPVESPATLARSLKAAEAHRAGSDMSAADYAFGLGLDAILAGLRETLARQTLSG
ncbi:TetR/AcrR family transcriptional regulator [Leucobacter sp. HY1910]